MADAAPHYVTVADRQLRVWRCGAGPDLVALAGLTLAAEDTANLLAGACPGWRVTAVECPGVGGSSGCLDLDPDGIADAVAAAIEGCGIGGCALVALDWAGALLPGVVSWLKAAPTAVIVVGAERATAWSARAVAPPDLRPRQDGAHLTALWAFLRDLHILDPADPTLPASAGPAIPTPAMLDRLVVAAAVRPDGFAAAWRACGAGPSAAALAVSALDDLPVFLASNRPAADGKSLPPTAALPDGRLWRQSVDTARGRMHLRRAGASGRPLLVLPTGGGSSAQFAPVVTGLARDRQVMAVDYLGNGLSDKPDRAVTIEMLAADIAALIGGLGFDSVDLWGSHTGALVALEVAVRYPDLVGRVVLEGPVFVSPEFQHDLLARYFPAIRPDGWGLHLPLVWNWRRDMFLFWPWYRAERAAARRLGLPRAQHLHDYAVGILESGPTYDGAYRAAFSYDTRARFPLLARPTLVCAGPNDMLIDGLAEAERLAVPGVEVRTTPTTVWWPDPDPAAAAETLAIYDVFLRG